jgi:hypothetical protein
MSTDEQKGKPATKIRPLAKFGRTAIWKNVVETATGSKTVWSVTLGLPRDRDPQTGEWHDRPSYRPSDLGSLVYDIERAIQFLYDQAENNVYDDDHKPIQKSDADAR